MHSWDHANSEYYQMWGVELISNKGNKQIQIKFKQTARLEDSKFCWSLTSYSKPAVVCDFNDRLLQYFSEFFGVGHLGRSFLFLLKRKYSKNLSV